MGKTKFDYEAEEFQSSFSNYMDKKIALYGIGRMTATLLERIQEFSIIGLLDKDESLIGTEIYGFKILSREEAEREADIVIINTAEMYWRTIYQRISDWNIPIYFRNGELAKEKQIDNVEMWNGSLAELREKTNNAEVVSFDIFDTLIMRKFMFSNDILKVVDERVRKLYDVEWLDIRQKSVSLLNEPTIDEIYVKIQELTGWNEKLVSSIEQLEIDGDMSCIVPRQDMIAFCMDTMSKTEVYFVSDMYYTSDILQQILLKCGLQVDKEQIIVSCEQRKSKISGKLWKYYKEEVIKDRKALHIGDNKESDIKLANMYGIDAYYVMNSFVMLQHSSIGELVPKVCSLYASACMGLICSKIFNSPFALHKHKGKVVFESNEIAGYCILGAFQFSFLSWLLGKVKQDDVDTIAFLARDGYLIMGQYEYLCSLLRNRQFPRAVYMEISRRTIMNASVEKPEDIYDIMRFPFDGTVNELLEKRFAITNDDKSGNISIGEAQKQGYSVEQIVKNMQDVIFQQTQKERKAYLEYLDTLNLSENFAIVDTMLYGTNQYYLGKLLNRKLIGYYFTACVEETSKNVERNIMYGCFQRSEDVSGKNTSLWKNAVFSDAFFTSPEGMLLYIDETGKKIYSPKMSNQKFFEVREKMQQGIYMFFEEMLDIQVAQELENIWQDNYFADDMLGVWLQGGFVPTEEMKKSFFFDNALLNNRELALWE